MKKGTYIPYVPVGSIRKNRGKLSKDIDFEELLANTESKKIVEFREKQDI